MPRIGKRILKSSLAVFLCFLIYLLRNEEGIVFYSCIAAVLCMQQDTSNTPVSYTHLDVYKRQVKAWNGYVPHTGNRD